MKMKKNLNRWITRPLSVMMALVLLLSVLLVPASAEGEVDDATLNDDVLEDGSGAFFQAGYAIHADEKNVLYTATLDA